MLHNHPLDQLIHDDSLFFLEAMIPFVDYAYKKPLILLIKYQEIRSPVVAGNHRDFHNYYLVAVPVIQNHSSPA